MAVTFTQAVTPVATTLVGAPGYTTGSFTPSANKLYLAIGVYVPVTVAGGVFSGFSSTTGLSFVTIGSARPYGTTLGAVVVARAMKPSGLGAGTVTMDFTSGNRTGGIIMIVEADGVDIGGTDGSNAVLQGTYADGASGVPTVTLASFASGSNATFGAMGMDANALPTAGGAFTLLSSGQFVTPGTGGGVESAPGNQTTVDFGTVAVPWAAFGCEIVAASGGGGGTANPFYYFRQQ